MIDENIINKSTPEQLRDFATKIDKYCSEISTSFEEFLGNHKKVGEHWEGKQYDQFTERFVSLQKQIKQKLDELEKLKEYILLKADELEKAQNISI